MNRAPAVASTGMLVAWLSSLGCADDEPELADPTAAAETAATEAERTIHDGTGLIIGEGWELVGEPWCAHHMR